MAKRDKSVLFFGLSGLVVGTIFGFVLFNDSIILSTSIGFLSGLIFGNIACDVMGRI